MDITFYCRADIQACVKARRILHKLADEYQLQIGEAAVPLDRVVKAPAIEVAGSRLRVLDSSSGALTEQTIRAYLELARKTGAPSRQIPNASDSEVTRGQTSNSPKSRAEHPIKSYLWQHRVGAVVGALSVFLGLAWVAPLLDSLGIRGVYSSIFAAYRLVCVQTPERSPFVGDHQCCLCWRCVAIYGGSLLFGILYALGRDGRLPRMQWLTRAVGLKGLIIFSLPMLADGLSHLLGMRAGPMYAYSPDFWLGWGEWQADWLLRTATALLATVGAVKFLCPRLDKIAETYIARQGGMIMRNA
jgi:uncharacterized membrane protein